MEKILREVRRANIRADIHNLRRMTHPRDSIDARADCYLADYANFAMLEKLQIARAKGRGGWWDDKDCPIERLRDMLKAILLYTTL